MKLLLLLAVTLLVVLVAPAAFADTYAILGTGAGNLLDSPATYSGPLMGDLIGTWEFTISDVLWPPPTPVGPRFDYIWSTFFAPNYDGTPGEEHWTGEFNGTTLPAIPQFYFNVFTPPGTLGGGLAIVIQVQDLDGDGVLSVMEREADHQLSATMTIDKDLGTGTFESMCGNGSFATAEFSFVDPPGTDSLTLAGLLVIDDCHTPAEHRSWTSIKGLYR